MNEQSLPVLTFMGNCVVELYGVDPTASYQHAFVYVRQLALNLRNGMVKKTKDALQAVQGREEVRSARTGRTDDATLGAVEISTDDQAALDEARRKDRMRYFEWLGRIMMSPAAR